MPSPRSMFTPLTAQERSALLCALELEIPLHRVVGAPRYRAPGAPRVNGHARKEFP